MSDLQTSAIRVFPYVLVVAGVKVACGLLALWYSTQTGHEPANLSTAASFLAAGAAIGWYSYRVNRPMHRREMVRFASGAALVDLLLSCLVFVVPIVWAGETVSMRNIDLVLGGDGNGLTSKDLVPLGFLAVFITLVTFLVSLFVAWSMTRKLPRRTVSG